MCSLKYTRLDEAHASRHIPVTSIPLLIRSLSLGAATNQPWLVKENKTAFLFPPHFQSSQGHPSLLPRLVLRGGGGPISNGVGSIFCYSHHRINEGCVIQGATLSHVWGSWVPSQGQRAFPTSKTNQILISCLLILGFKGNPKLDYRTRGFWCNNDMQQWACHSAAHLQRVPPALSLEQSMKGCQSPGAQWVVPLQCAPWPSSQVIRQALILTLFEGPGLTPGLPTSGVMAHTHPQPLWMFFHLPRTRAALDFGSLFVFLRTNGLSCLPLRHPPTASQNCSDFIGKSLTEWHFPGSGEVQLLSASPLELFREQDSLISSASFSHLALVL